MKHYVKKNTRPPRAGEGRPPRTTDDLPSDWKDTILEMSAKGCSAVEIRANLCMAGGKFNHVTWDKLKEREQEFLSTIKKGDVLCQAWWEKKARENVTHSKDSVFETGAWFANMKNRFAWQDKVEIEHDLAEDIKEKRKLNSIGDLKNRLAGLLGNGQI